MNDLPLEAVPTLTTSQMREVDRRMIEEFHIELVQMMENAGRSLAELALRRFGPVDVVVLAGRVAPQAVADERIDDQGGRPRVGPDGDAHPLHDVELVGGDGGELGLGEHHGHVHAPVDQVAGGHQPATAVAARAGRAAELITWAGGQTTVLALDTPSGLDVTTGRPAQPCVRATATLTLALPKVGLVGAAEVGELYLADISVPPRLYREMGLEVPALFTRSSIIQLVGEQRGSDG